MLLYVIIHIQLPDMAIKKKTHPLALMGYEIDNKVMSEMKQ